MHEQAVVIQRLFYFVQNERCRRDRIVEARRVDGNAFVAAEARVPFALEGRTRKDEREIDVEENCANRQGRSLDCEIAGCAALSDALRITASPVFGPHHGPATTMTARAGCINRWATVLT
jgi:hypothetical protein